MRYFLKSQKSLYQKRSYEVQAAFAANVANLMSADPAYQAKSEAVSELKALTEQFRVAIDKARDGADSHTAVRNQLREKVVKTLDGIHDWLKFNNTGDPLWAINAGFKVTAKESKSNTGIMLPPTGLKLIPTGIEGQLKAKFKLPNSAVVKKNAVEYSLDNGVTWQNGTYGNASGILLNNLPKKQVILVRVRSLGSGSDVSGWSEVAEAFLF